MGFGFMDFVLSHYILGFQEITHTSQSIILHTIFIEMGCEDGHSKITYKGNGQIYRTSL